MIEILKKTKALVEGRAESALWKHRNSIMLDVFLRKERHIHIKPDSALGKFGPSVEDELID